MATEVTVFRENRRETERESARDLLLQSSVSFSPLYCRPSVCCVRLTYGYCLHMGTPGLPCFPAVFLQLSPPLLLSAVCFPSVKQHFASTNRTKSWECFAFFQGCRSTTPYEIPWLSANSFSHPSPMLFPSLALSLSVCLLILAVSLVNTH